MAVEPGQSTPLLIDKAHKTSVTTDIMLDESVAAPVSTGQRLGTMTVRAGDQTLMQVPMVAATSVPRLSYGDIFMQVLRKMLMAK